MPSDEETIQALAKLTLRHKALIDILLGVSNDFARLIEPMLERCCGSSCHESATVNHVDLNVRMCDRHAAAAIVLARKNLEAAPLDSMSLLRTRIADEECWVDLSTALQVRRLQGYVHELKKHDEPDPPDMSMRH